LTLSYAAFTLSGFDEQERNLTFVKTAFQVLKLLYNFLLAVWSKLSIYFTNKISRKLDNTKVLFTSFPFGTWLSNLYV